MQKYRIYLDNCCFNRPFDDQSQEKIFLEASAKLRIQAMIKADELELVWSYVLDYENEKNPFSDRKKSINDWKKFCKIDIGESETLIKRAEHLQTINFSLYDALHVSCAIEARCRYFFTTDKKIVKDGKNIKEISIINPVTFFIDQEVTDED